MIFKWDFFYGGNAQMTQPVLRDYCAACLFCNPRFIKTIKDFTLEIETFFSLWGSAEQDKDGAGQYWHPKRSEITMTALCSY